MLTNSEEIDRRLAIEHQFSGVDYLLISYREDPKNPEKTTGKLRLEVNNEVQMEKALFRLASNNAYFGTILLKAARRLEELGRNSSQN